MKRIILALALLVAAPALAQRADDMARTPTPRTPPKLTGNPINDIKSAINGTNPDGTPVDDATALRKKLLSDLSKPFIDLANYIGDDAEGAITLSTSIPGIQDGHGQQCWIKARNFTAVFKAHPLPLTGAAMTDLEALRLLAISSKQLCEDAHCTQVFTDFKNMAITVAQAGFGAIGATAVRSAPSLQDVCTQVPNIPLVDPVASVPPSPVVTAPAAPAPSPPQ